MYDDQIGPIALLNVMDLPTGDFDKLSVGRETKLCLGFILKLLNYENVP